MRITLGRLLYGLFFCAGLPAWLIVWAGLTEHLIPVKIEGLGTQMIGLCLAVVGVLIQLTAMWCLWREGRGLPMNAFPPEQYVVTGPYRYMRHPIYTGFILSCAGASLGCLSSSGLFLVTPVMALLCVALVLGYEQPGLKSLFGAKPSLHVPLLGPSADVDLPASAVSRAASGLVVFVPWLLLYYWLIFLGDSPKFFTLALPGEQEWLVWPWTEVFYGMTYPFVLAVPLLLREQHALRSFVLTGWWITGSGIFLQYVLPIHAPPRPFEPVSVWGKLLMMERSMDGPVCAFPSFHVMWSLVAASYWSRAIPEGRWCWWLLAVLMSASCVTTGNHTIADVAAGVLVYMAVDRRQAVWSMLQRCSEWLANSWRSFRLGPLRVINHSLYAGLACGAGIFVMGQFITEQTILLVFTVMILGAACLWGQWVTGSSALQRPFGYYGAVLGAVLACWWITGLWPYSWLTLCGIAALAAPWVQAIGRLRCLVQGCCHGKPTGSQDGIRCTNPHSRVCSISQLSGVMIHNTQLYSIVSNVATGMLLWRLWYAAISPAMLAGLYAIMNGSFRFMEEAYRGEVQTPIYAGLRLYQWLSILSVAAGMIMTCVPGPEVLEIHWRVDLVLVANSCLCGLLAAFMMGMDFPQSRLRFARLSG